MRILSGMLRQHRAEQTQKSAAKHHSAFSKGIWEQGHHLSDAEVIITDVPDELPVIPVEVGLQSHLRTEG